jgi:O-antigen/teichoic acid export membrane protein
MEKSFSQRLSRFFAPATVDGPRWGFLTGTASVFILQIMGLASAYIMQALLARWMGSKDFGDYIYAYNWARLLALFGGLGFTLSTLKFVPTYIMEKSWDKLRGLITTFSLLTLAGSGILTLGAIAVFSVFSPQDIDSTTLMIGLLITPLIALTYLYVEILRGLDSIFVAYSSVAVGQNVLMIIVGGGILLALGALTNIQAISALALVTLLIAAIQLFAIIRSLPAPARTVKAAYETKHWIRTSFPMLLIRSYAILMERVDVLLIGMLLGAVPTGIYAVASRTANLASFALQAVNAITAPQIAPLYKQQKMDELERIARRATQLSTLASFVLFVGLVVFSQLLLSLFGEEYLVGQRTLIILGIGQLVNSSMGPVGFLMHLTDHQHISQRVYGVSMVVNITLNLILIPVLNIEGAALGTTFTIILQNVWMYILVRKYLNIDTFAIRLKRRS